MANQGHLESAEEWPQCTLR